MPLTPLDYADCSQKKCSTSNGSVIFACDNPCEDEAAFDYATGICDDGTGSYSLILRLRGAGFDATPSLCRGRGSISPADYFCETGSQFIVDSTEYQTYGGFTAPFSFQVMNDFQLPYFFPSSRTCAFQYAPEVAPLTDYPDLEARGKAQRKYRLRDADDRTVIRYVSIILYGPSH